MGNCIKESFSTVAKKDIIADLEIRGKELYYRTEEMVEFLPLADELKYFNGAYVKITFKQETKYEELPVDDSDKIVEDEVEE